MGLWAFHFLMHGFHIINYFTWPVLQLASHQFCENDNFSCDEEKVHDMLHLVKVEQKVWYLVGIDITDAHKVTSKGIRYIPALPDKSVEVLTQGLYTTYCCHGAPAHVISDQGGELVNKVTFITCYSDSGNIFTFYLMCLVFADIRLPIFLI